MSLSQHNDIPWGGPVCWHNHWCGLVRGVVVGRVVMGCAVDDVRGASIPAENSYVRGPCETIVATDFVNKVDGGVITAAFETPWVRAWR